MRKRKSSIIPFGDFEKVQEQEQAQFNQEQEESFYTNPLIPWWIKAAYALSPVPLHKPDRADTWCKLCGRKHSKRDACESLRLVEDLTEPPTKRNKDGELIANRTVGYYTTRPKEALAA
jgi:hypothetical protein